MLDVGVKGSSTVIVDEGNTALAIGSGTLRVFATPAMIALVESTASRSVAPFLDEFKGKRYADKALIFL